jgi:hypothetical protein
VRRLGVSLIFTHVVGVLVLAIETGDTYPRRTCNHGAAHRGALPSLHWRRRCSFIVVAESIWQPVPLVIAMFPVWWKLIDLSFVCQYTILGSLDAAGPCFS